MLTPISPSNTQLFWSHSAAAPGRCFAAKACNPAVYDICGTATPIIRVDIDGINGAISGTGSALHTPVEINDLSLTVSHLEYTMRADLFTVAATDAQLFLQS